jgi:hypothetical protein
MNWTYLGIAALLPLTIALAATLLAGAIQAIRSNREGGSSAVAFRRLLRTLAVVFPLAFLAATLWDGRSTWRGLLGAALGHPTDQRAMGILCLRGEGFLAKNPARAKYWLQKSAEGGDAEAQLLLARAYLSGSGLPRDPRAALQWAQIAADHGLPDAMVLTGDLMRPADAEAANAWYNRAMAAYQVRIQAGEADACLFYGLMYTSGRGVPKDLTEGLAWMRVAERRGLPPLRVIAVRLTEGKATPAQRAEATQRAEAIQKTLPP